MVWLPPSMACACALRRSLAKESRHAARDGVPCHRWSSRVESTQETSSGSIGSNFVNAYLSG